MGATEARRRRCLGSASLRLSSARRAPRRSEMHPRPLGTPFSRALARAGSRGRRGRRGGDARRAPGDVAQTLAGHASCQSAPK
eukprot:4447372-Pyramimonas_sp.AAC.1